MTGLGWVFVFFVSGVGASTTMGIKVLQPIPDRCSSSQERRRQVVPDGEMLELSLEAYCRITKVVPPATPSMVVATPTHTATPSAPKPLATTPSPAHTATPSAPKPHATPSAPAVRAHKEYGPKGHPGPANRHDFDPKKSSRLT